MMLRKIVRPAQWMVGYGALALLLGACAPGQQPFAQATTPTLEPTPTVEALTVASPEPVETAAPPITTLTVWLPDRIVPAEDELLNELINAQTRAFSLSEDIVIDLRRKRAQDVGGIMSTLRTASSVAPGALPDVTLIRREDLLVAVQNGLIQPLEGMVNSAIIADLYPSAIQLGQVNDQLYGLPYLLEAQIVAYQGTPGESNTDWAFSAVLDAERTFVFPASRPAGVSEVFLLQYLAAGGTFNLNDPSEQAVNQAALLTVLQFYEDMLNAGLIDDRVLEYTNSSDYQFALLDNLISSGVVSTNTFWQLLTRNDTLQVGFIPTPDGAPTTLLNGWVWVIVTNNTERQRAAASFINWMMGIDRQLEYVQAIRILPSRQTAFRALDLGGVNSTVLDQVLSSAHVPFSDVALMPIMRQMQTALAAVLRGESTAQEAALDLIAELSG